ncbi:unnamed protein product [Ixodes hexagonus]
MDREQLEQENQRLADQLSNKVSHLKSLAYDMEVETKEHNRLLGGLVSPWPLHKGSHGGNVWMSGFCNKGVWQVWGTSPTLHACNRGHVLLPLSVQSWDFEGSHGLLSSSLGRVNKMVGAGKGNRRLACYMALLVVALVLVGYVLASRR